MKKTTIIFYVTSPDYFPIFIPIAKQFEKDRSNSVILLLSRKQSADLIVSIAKQESLTYLVGEEHLHKLHADYIFFANLYEGSEKLLGKTIFIDHGVGTEACDYHTALLTNDIVLVEGDYRKETLIASYPEFKTKIKKVGFSKLDLAFSMPYPDKETVFQSIRLDKNKKTILYAPSFSPSSIEKMPDSFPDDFNEYNVIIKPQYMSFESRQYKKQQRKFKKWHEFTNCHVCNVKDYSLISYLILADLMISDETSVIFEFAAFNKPVIINRFLRFQWSYYMFPKKNKNRMDLIIEPYRRIGDHASTYRTMRYLVQNNLHFPEKHHLIRKTFTKEICGTVDGHVSERIVKAVSEVK